MYYTVVNNRTGPNCAVVHTVHHTLPILSVWHINMSTITTAYYISPIAGSEKERRTKIDLW